jgi:hypothetical protein
MCGKMLRSEWAWLKKYAVEHKSQPAVTGEQLLHVLAEIEELAGWWQSGSVMAPPVRPKWMPQPIVELPVAKARPWFRE